MILTPTSLRNLENVKIGLQSSKAILIQGEVGCGKSTIVDFLAEQFRKKDTMIQINVDDSFDNKDLLGKFSATDTPGAFEWVPGPLTVAVQKGYWILMEDIDLASFDVFSVILSLLENSTLFLADKNVTIQAHLDFKLIATQQLYTSGASLFSYRSSTVPFMELWSAVIMEPIPPDEVLFIIHSLYSDVPESALKNLSLLKSDQSGYPLLTLRDLLKWSSRVDKSFKQICEIYKNQNTKNNANTGFISSSLREGMLREAFDCFLAKYPRGRLKECMLSMVATACGVPENVANSIVYANKPCEKASDSTYSIGRVSLPCVSLPKKASSERTVFAPTVHAMCLIERLAACVQSRENVLLTGETGVGKTFIVQYLADQLGQKLIVHNLNQQTDTSDFMGGWKPLDVGLPIRQTYLTFVRLFSQCFNVEKNISFLNVLKQAVSSRKWDRALRQLLKGCETFWLKNERSSFSPETQKEWKDLHDGSEELLRRVEKAQTSFSFYYEEGSLVKAWREGHWILLDELNLACTEVLERVSSILGEVDQLFLTDKDHLKPIARHSNFRVFANMNPPTDVGKKDLPPSLRCRFTEFYVSEPFNPTDINIIVQEYIGFLSPESSKYCITNFFLDCVLNAKSRLCTLDGESKAPSFSLRTLTRTLAYVRKAAPLYGYDVALYDGLMLGFATPLQRQFHKVVESLIVKNIFHGKKPASPRLPPIPNKGKHVHYEHIWIAAGDQPCLRDPLFILTDSIKGHLTNLARANFANRPVLLEGPTSSGKSSMVRYLAALTGNKFVRINNHESTEVQEYLGHYVTDELGKLSFVDGILVTAVRQGYWVILDELNLAPTDVLEALNRLLDDNRELFVPDTQEVIKAHPHFRIFATQNPAGLYGGRKLLSRAFRNRFLEITVDEIPNKEINFILQQRYALPESFAEKMVNVMSSLQTTRQSSQIFAGRHGFITPRDLFSWAERKPSTFQELAEQGFLLLGERCRKQKERQIVKDIIESVTRTEINEEVVYSPSHWSFVKKYFEKIESGAIDEYEIVWTPSMQRLFTIVGLCLEHKEPVLLVGETGSSKTTICQLWAALLGIPLRILNCHQHTEAADFLGSFRPVPPDRRDHALFEWHNGPLVQSMIDGYFFILDEISLAEDSVLEGLNSLLEPSRSITLTEKSSVDHIVAHEAFRIMATMNPGGDFGKKELSPALRSRFTEIYVRPTTSRDEVSLIVSKRLEPELKIWAEKIADVLCSVSELSPQSKTQTHISIRDVVGWVSFMNAAHGRCPPALAFLQGFEAVILDGIGVGIGISGAPIENLKRTCLKKAQELLVLDPALEVIARQPFWTFFESMSEPELPFDMQKRFFFGAPTTQRNLSKLMRASILKKAVLLEGSPGVGKTSIVEALGCALGGHRVVRINLSEQTDIMDLLGSFLPCSTQPYEEIGEPQPNGATLQSRPQFAWSDGILLRALKEGGWVILDELNLASQSVLEGLNALLDHRSSVFIPELNEEYRAHEDFRVFACQNPLIEGGGRKGLPRSFLNRFLRVHIDAFQTEDLIVIGKSICPNVNYETLQNIVKFVETLQRETMERRSFALRGSPWEFNLRDVLRWVNLMEAYNLHGEPTYFADMLFLKRMRTQEDETRCLELLMQYFPGAVDMFYSTYSDFLIKGESIYYGRHYLTERLEPSQGDNTCRVDDNTLPLLLLPSQSCIVKSLLICAHQSQFVLLVGPSGAGKTFTLKTAAALVGAKLVTFSMTASCDTVDLLGGFDQVEGKQGQFEWRDSLLLESMLMGYWMVLDNVNYCNASVLDRLNPLVEPNGFLSINEQGLVNGEVRIIRPHPNFRLFATLNPRYGEISRAMRNRAVELFVPPVAIPSSEAAMLEIAAHAQATTDAIREEDKWLDKVMTFHKLFIKVAFGADSMKSASGALCDALTAGAPNIYTLQRSCAILRSMLDHQEEGDLKKLEKCLLHRYISNRSGPWMYKKPELLDALREVLEVQASVSSTHVSPRHLVHVSRLNLKAIGSSEVLERQRVARQALPLEKVLTQTIRLDDSWNPINADDVVFYFILEQSNDSVRLPGLALKRRQVLCDMFPTKDFSDIYPLLDEQYCSAEMLDTLYCKAAFFVGPGSSTLSSITPKVLASCPERINISSSPTLNQSLAQVLYTTAKCLPYLTSPLEFQNISTALRSFLEQLIYCGSLCADNYVSIATQSLLLRDACSENYLHSSECLIKEILSAVENFIDSIRSYLDLPFSLIGGSSVLEGFVPQLHITTKEERTLISQWQARTEPSQEQPSMESNNLSQQLLRELWEVAVYRGEYEMIQHLLSVFVMASPAADGWETYLSGLRRFISALLDKYKNNYFVFSEFEIVLWRSLLTMKWHEAQEEIQQYAPLLICRFITRYDLHAVVHLFPGSWINTATKCLKYASKVSVLAIGQASNDHLHILLGLLNFLDKCPALPVRVFAIWERNAQRELPILTKAYFSKSSLSEKILSSLDAPENDTTAILRSVRSLLICSSTILLNDANKAHKKLFLKLVNCMDRGHGFPNTTSHVLTGVALLYIFKCRLLVPTSPIDPMYRYQCEMKSSGEQVTILKRLEAIFKWAEQVALHGSGLSPQLRLLSSLRTQQQERLCKASEKFIERPDVSGMHYAALVRQMHQLNSTLLSDEHLDAVFCDEMLSESTHVEARVSWSELLFQSVTELLSKYGGYEDVTLNFAQAALLASMAARASCHNIGNKSAPVDLSINNRDCLIGLNEGVQHLQFPICLWSVPLPSLRVISNSKGASLRSVLEYLDGCLKMLKAFDAHMVDSNFVENVFLIYHELYRAVEKQEQEEQRADEIDVLYKEKAVVIEGDDEKLLRKLRDLLPNYEQDFTNMDINTASVSEKNDTLNVRTSSLVADDGRSARYTRIIFHERNGVHLRHLIDTYAFFFERLVGNRMEQRSVSANCLLDAFKIHFDILSAEMARFGDGPTASFITGDQECLLLSGFAFRAQLLRANLDHGARALASETASLKERYRSGFNIFLDADPGEVSRFSKPLGELLSAVDGLAAIYPDTFSLQRCQRIARKIALLPALTTPLMKILSGCEVLLAECYEWERNASKEVSIMSHISKLSEFVLRWRRMELHCWFHVFKAKRNEFEMCASNKWFSLYDMVQSTKQTLSSLGKGSTTKHNWHAHTEWLAEQCSDLFEKLAAYLWEACYGDFDIRLLIVKSIGLELLATHGVGTPLANVALHVADYFTQFSNFIQQKMSHAVQPIEQDMSEFTKIMRWEDANYYAVRATSEKAHLKLARALSAFEDVLRTPIRIVIAEQEQAIQDDPGMGMDSAEVPSQSPKLTLRSPTDQKAGVQNMRLLAHLRDYQDTRVRDPHGIKRQRVNRETSQSKIKEPITPPNPFEGWPSRVMAAAYEFFSQSSSEILQRVKALQAPKTPYQMKIRALKTLFGVLNQFGVPDNHEAQMGSWDVLFSTTKPMLAFRSLNNNNSSLLTQLEISEKKYYTFVRWVQLMREAEAGKTHPDLSEAQVRRGTGLSECLFAHAVEFTDLVCGIIDLNGLLYTLEVFLKSSSPETDRSETGLHHKNKLFTDSVAVLDTAMRLCCATQSFHASLEWFLSQKNLCPSDEVSLHPLVVELGSKAQHLWDLCIQHEPIRRNQVPLPANLAKQLLHAFEKVTSVCSRLCDLKMNTNTCIKEKNTGVHSIATIAATHRIRIAEFMAELDITDDSHKCDNVSNDDAKRPRTERSHARQWINDLDDLLQTLLHAFVEEGDTPTILSSKAQPLPDSDDSSPSLTIGFKDYQKKLIGLRQCTQDAVTTLHRLLHPDVTVFNGAHGVMSLFSEVKMCGKAPLLQRLSRVSVLLGVAQNALIQTLNVHVELGLVLARLFTILMKKGFCKPEDQENDDEAEGDGDGEKQRDGTGMDDGEGEKDVTNEIDNEDQLMKMKDKEEQQQEQKDKGQDEEDNAADVETDFQAEKQNRHESDTDTNDDDDHDEEESDKEMGSVDGEDERERKKTRKDKVDNDDMREDEQDRTTSEVPEDKLPQEDNIEGEEDETGNFEDKQKEIRDAEEKRDGEHELVGEEDEHGMLSEDLEDSTSKESARSGESLDRSLSSAEDENASDEEGDRDSQQESKQGKDKSEDCEDMSASIDNDKESHRDGDDEREMGMDDTDLPSDDLENQNVDEKDENVVEGGFQDQEHGEEATNQKQRDPATTQQQPDAIGNEEEQPDQQEEQDDAGRSWKKQQKQNQQLQRKDNSERKRAKHNPYHAIKEAAQRRERGVQQLDFNKRVNVTNADPSKDTKEQLQNEDSEKPEENVQDEFDFDEDGEQKGMAATDEQEHERVNETEQYLESEYNENESETSESGNEKDLTDTPQDTCRRRRKQAEEIMQEDKEAASKDGLRNKKKKFRQTLKLTAHSESDESEEREAIAEGETVTSERDVVNTVDQKLERGRLLWQEQEAFVQALSQQLCEQLRLVLSPTRADKLQGDYKTGKRLNMKRIIPYIASQFKKDRIWLRRTKPSKRTYQVMLALDDSLSMQCNNAGVMSCRAVALIAKALQQLEVGEIGIACFGKETKIIHPMEEAFIADSGPRALGEITFAQTSTNLKLFLETTLTYLDAARGRAEAQTRSTTQQLQQIMFIISDGQITEDRAEIRKLLVRAEENHQMVVFALLDLKVNHSKNKVDGTVVANPLKPQPLLADDLKGLSTAERLRRLKADREARLKRVQSNSILDMQIVEFKQGKVIRRPYMEDFPFPYYLIVRELESLPEVIADAMRQWFELLNAR